MIDKKIEEKLKNLRELYLDKHSETAPETELVQEFDVFTTLTPEEKEQKLLSQLAFVSQKIAQLEQELSEMRENNAAPSDFAELKYYIDAVKNKKIILEQKIDFIRSGEFDAARKEKIKRQLTDLELKRCKALLSKKDLSKIDEKIALKKETIKRFK